MNRCALAPQKLSSQMDQIPSTIASVNLFFPSIDSASTRFHSRLRLPKLIVSYRERFPLRTKSNETVAGMFGKFPDNEFSPLRTSCCRLVSGKTFLHASRVCGKGRKEAWPSNVCAMHEEEQFFCNRLR